LQGVQGAGEPRHQRLVQAAAGELVFQLLLIDQAQLDLATAADAQRAKVVEALRDLLAVAHDMRRLLLAQHPQRGLLFVIVVLAVGLERCELERILDRAVERARQPAERFQGLTLDLLKHAHRIGTRSLSDAVRIAGHCLFPCCVDRTCRAPAVGRRIVARYDLALQAHFEQL
jgi:hypothetical protein